MPETVGLSLADGKEVLHWLQQTVVAAQSEEIYALRRVRSRCGRWLALKDYRMRKVDTVFGRVAFRSARIVSYPCEPPYFLELNTARCRHTCRSERRQNRPDGCGLCCAM
ncbi:hypothetical protein D3C72_1720200 [compost metagenome]